MRSWLFILFVLGLAVTTDSSRADRTLPDYRYFRALSIDLVGRPPTRAELAAFEQPGFDLEHWLDVRMHGPTYVERLRRIYLDLLRLEIPDAVQWKPPATQLHWTTIVDEHGTGMALYYRPTQRRLRPEIDAQVCFTEAEAGIKIGGDSRAVGTPKPIPQALLDARTVIVKPWWLYADYRAADPQDRAAADWVGRFGYDLQLAIFVEPDGKKTPMTGVRVCREEAQPASTGHIHASRRVVKKSDPLLPGRLTRLPEDTPFATANAGHPVTCGTYTALQSSVDCGCGVGLERCMPTGPAGFVMPTDAPLGIAQPFQKTPRPAALWMRTWWTEEATRFIDDVVDNDRDMRELLTSRGTIINGPLAQFYRFFANAGCCGQASELGYSEAEPLFDPAAVPASLLPVDAATWTPIPDRGPHAAGLMTMPVFLLKYGSRRQRAHVIYNAFMCKELVAEHVKLVASTEPDLTKRSGCAACHQRLEPMAAYFSRIQESDWTYLPPSKFPISSIACAAEPAKMSRACKTYYDPAFTDVHHSVLRGAYAAPKHVDAGPQQFALDVTSSPEFAPCVVKNIAQSLLGRPLGGADETWKQTLAQLFVANGYRLAPLVRSILTSPAYHDVDDRKPVSR
ncbi:MAG: DUF1592 domain-containing protein [Kofleriaceae bacterium]